jgi:hypothetical protein
MQTFVLIILTTKKIGLELEYDKNVITVNILDLVKKKDGLT